MHLWYEYFRVLLHKIGSKFKEKQNIALQCEAMTSHLLASSSLLVENVSTSIVNISRTEHGK